MQVEARSSGAHRRGSQLSAHLCLVCQKPLVQPSVVSGISNCCVFEFAPGRSDISRTLPALPHPDTPLVSLSGKKPIGILAVGLQKPGFKVSSGAQLKSKMFIGVLYKNVSSQKMCITKHWRGKKDHTFGMHLKNHQYTSERKVQTPPPPPPHPAVLEAYSLPDGRKTWWAVLLA